MTENTMKGQMKELQKLIGIGEVLARRLDESSYDAIAKVAAAEEKMLGENSGNESAKGELYSSPRMEESGRS